MYELFIEGYKVDIDQKLSIQLTFAIDDISNFSSRDTSFSKQIIIPGTALNNKIFGFIYDLGSFNYEYPNAPNIGAIFNVAQTSRAELRLNGLLVLKGVFRMTNIVKDKDLIEYEGSIFGEMSGFIAQVGTKQLNELDFSEHNHTYTRDNIVNSWNSIDGSGYYYPLIDYGTYSNNKISYDYRTFRPALYVKEYIDKIFQNAGYTYESQFFDTDFFKSIIIPNNAKELRTLGNRVLEIACSGTIGNDGVDDNVLIFDFYFFLGDFENSDDGTEYTYNGASTFKPVVGLNITDLSLVQYSNVELKIKIYIKLQNGAAISLFGANGNDSLTSFDFIIPAERKVFKASSSNQGATTFSGQVITFTSNPFSKPINPAIGSTLILSNTLYNNGTYIVIGSDTNRIVVNKVLKSDIAFATYDFQPLLRTNPIVTLPNYNISNLLLSQNITNNSIISVVFYFQNLTEAFIKVPIRANASLSVASQVPISTKAVLNDPLYLNDSLPKNILQKDFFVWLLKMFNLYVVEDLTKEKHLIIEPYVNYYNNDEIDWTYKVARDKPWQIKPMGMLNARRFEYKYKEDNDYYNENFKKKYNIPYGSRLEDTGYQYAKDKETVTIGFSPSVLVQYVNTDKVVTTLYKRGKGNSVDQEELTDTNIRILIAKKVNSVASWYIVNTLNFINPLLGAALTSYGYAGHFDDPKNPTKDLNYGACEEIYFDPNTYTTNNLFNDYWSQYLAEIVDKDSKILTCYVHLTPLDIAKLDFRRPVRIDNVLFRINKIEDYDYVNNELVKVELLKIINNG